MRAKIEADLKEAMKAKRSHEVTTLRGLVSEIKNKEINTRSDVDEAAVISIIQKEVKKRRDTISFAKDAGRDEMVAQNEEEIAMLQRYLPKQLSEDELRSKVQELVDGGANNIGAVMGALNKDYKGQFDGKQASGLAKEILG